MQRCRKEEGEGGVQEMQGKASLTTLQPLFGPQESLSGVDKVLIKQSHRHGRLRRVYGGGVSQDGLPLLVTTQTTWRRKPADQPQFSGGAVSSRREGESEPNTSQGEGESTLGGVEGVVVWAAHDGHTAILVDHEKDIVAEKDADSGSVDGAISRVDAHGEVGAGGGSTGGEEEVLTGLVEGEGECASRGGDRGGTVPDTLGGRGRGSGHGLCEGGVCVCTCVCMHVTVYGKEKLTATPA